MRKRSLLIITITVLILAALQWLVVKQYLGNRHFRSAMACVDQYLSDQNTLTGGECLVRFDRAIRWTPSNAHIHYEGAKHHERLMHQAAALDGAWEERNWRVFFNEGERAKNFENRALAWYRRAIELNPSVHHYHLDLALFIASKLYVGMRAGDDLHSIDAPVPAPLSAAAAFREFTLAVQLAPNRLYNHLVFADWLVEHMVRTRPEKTVKEELTSLARRHYRQVLAREPNRLPSILASLTRVAIGYDDLVLVLPPDYQELPRLVAVLQARTDWPTNRERFLAHLNGLKESRDDRTDAPAGLLPFYMALADMLVREDRPEEAMARLGDYLALEPRAAGVHHRRALLALKLNDFDGAAEHAAKALAGDPENRSYLKTRVAALEGMADDRNDEVEKQLRLLIREHPDDSSAYEALGNRFRRAGLAGDAARIYGRIITDTGNKARGYYLLGTVYEEAGRTEEARENLKRAALLDRRYRDHFNRTLPLNLLLEEYFTVTRDYSRLKGLLPRRPETVSALALFLHRKKAWLPNRSSFMTDLAAARRDFEAVAGTPGAEEIRRSWLMAYYRSLLEIYRLEGKRKSALSLMEELAAVDPGNGEAHALLARTMIDGGLPLKNALAHYEKALALEPMNADFAREYAVVLAEAGRFEQAERLLLDRLEQLSRDPEMHAALGAVYEKAGRRNLAIDHLSRAVELSRGAPRYKEELARLLRGK